MIDVNSTNILTPTTHLARRNPPEFNQIPTRVDCHSYLFYLDTVRIGNHLLECSSMMTDIDTFRQDVSNY